MTNEDTLIPTDACNSLHLMEITISDYSASIKKKNKILACKLCWKYKIKLQSVMRYENSSFST